MEKKGDRGRFGLPGHPADQLLVNAQRLWNRPMRPNSTVVRNIGHSGWRHDLVDFIERVKPLHLPAHLLGEVTVGDLIG